MEWGGTKIGSWDIYSHYFDTFDLASGSSALPVSFRSALVFVMLHFVVRWNSIASLTQLGKLVHELLLWLMR